MQTTALADGNPPIAQKSLSMLTGHSLLQVLPLLFRGHLFCTLLPQLPHYTACCCFPVRLLLHHPPSPDIARCNSVLLCSAVHCCCSVLQCIVASRSGSVLQLGSSFAAAVWPLAIRVPNESETGMLSPLLLPFCSVAVSVCCSV